MLLMVTDLSYLAAAKTRQGIRRLGSPRLASLVGLLVCLAFFAVPGTAAAASTVYAKIGAFGGTGTGEGQFTGPARVAVDPATGDVFVADTGDGRIEVFSPTATGATFLTEFGSGVLSKPVGIAVDPTSGAVYVTDAGLNQIVKFDQTPGSPPTFTQDPSFVSPGQGTGAGQIGSFGTKSALGGAFFGGIAVDPTVDAATGTHDILVADPSNKLVERFDSNGNFISSFNGSSSGEAFTEPADLAVNSAGDLIVVDVNSSTNTARAVRFSSTGSFQATLGPVTNPAPTLSGVVVGSDVSTDQVFVSSTPQLGTPGAIDRFSGPEADPADSEIDSFGLPAGDAGFDGPFAGIAAQPASGSTAGRLYVMASSSLFSGSPQVQVFEAFTPPSVAIAPTTAISAAAATFNGTVNPSSSAVTNCQFQFVPATDSAGFTDAKSQACDTTPGAGTSDVPVQASVTSLAPNTAYLVRLVAANNGGLASATSSQATFTTQTAPPSVSRVSAIAGATMVSFRGEIDPNNSSTSYHFEYGTAPCDTNQCTQIPVPAANAGSGDTPVVVFARPVDLTPNTTYHFRLVANNGTGGNQASPDQTFTTNAAPSSRAYELVTPVPTGGANVRGDAYVSDSLPGDNYGSVATDGDRVLFQTANPLPGGDTPHFTYVATRGANGWTSQPVDAGPQGPTYVNLPQPRGSSADLTRVLLVTSFSFDPDDQNGNPDEQTNSDPPGSDLYLRQPDGTLTWVSRDPRIPVGTPQTDPATIDPAGAPFGSATSADGTTIVFESNRQLLSQGTEGIPQLYKWSDGALSFIGVLPDGSTDTGQDVLGGGGGFSSSVNAVSNDGSRVIWSDASSQLYEQIDGQPTVAISNPSPSECTTCSPTVARDVVYGGASTDGHQVFFTTSQQLVNADTDSTPDLYEYDFDQPAGRQIIQISAGGAGDATPGSGADVQGVVAVSDDGSHVYFVARGVLTTDPNPLGQTATAGANNMYLYERDSAHPSGQTTFIATLAPDSSGGFPGSDDTPIWDAGGPAAQQAHSSPDGTVLAFASRASVTGQANPSNCTDAGGNPVPCRELYVYDERDDTLACASCAGDGTPPVADMSIADPAAPSRLPAWVSSSGEVFFNSPTPLLPGITNSVGNVYEYDQGQLSLISAGTGSDASGFVGASTDGSTVFFLTDDALVPQDDEPGVYKIYAARVGGGFGGAPPPPPPPCFGDSCRAPFAGGTAQATAASVAFAGPGNANAASTAAAVAKPKVLTQTVHGTSFLVRVSAPGAGRITVTGQQVRTVRRLVSRRGSYSLRIALTKSARGTLDRRHGMRVRLNVRYAPATGPARTAAVNLTVKPTTYAIRKQHHDRHQSRRTHGGAK